MPTSDRVAALEPDFDDLIREVRAIARAMKVDPAEFAADLGLDERVLQIFASRDSEQPEFHRTAILTREAINVADRTVELSFSSEEPYDRWWGREVLSHERGAVRLGRLNDTRHPL